MVVGGSALCKRPHCPHRYFTAASEEFAGLKPGVLSAELRMALGALASTDPPPWLHRMRELGYPPGYMFVPDFVILHGGCSAFSHPRTFRNPRQGLACRLDEIRGIEAGFRHQAVHQHLSW